MHCLDSADESNHDSTSNLVQLLCAMQRSLLTWCNAQIKSGNTFGLDVATSLITDCKYYRFILMQAIIPFKCYGLSAAQTAYALSQFYYNITSYVVQILVALKYCQQHYKEKIMFFMFML